MISSLVLPAQPTARRTQTLNQDAAVHDTPGVGDQPPEALKVRHCRLVLHPPRLAEHRCALIGGGLEEHLLHRKLTRLPSLLHEDQVFPQRSGTFLGHRGRRVDVVLYEGCGSICSPKHPLSSHDQALLIATTLLASLTTSWDSKTREGLDRATKSSTEGNDGRPEEADTADSLGEECSTKQLETHHAHTIQT